MVKLSHMGEPCMLAVSASARNVEPPCGLAQRMWGEKMMPATTNRISHSADAAYCSLQGQRRGVCSAYSQGVWKPGTWVAAAASSQHGVVQDPSTVAPDSTCHANGDLYLPFCAPQRGGGPHQEEHGSGQASEQATSASNPVRDEQGGAKPQRLYL